MANASYLNSPLARVRQGSVSPVTYGSLGSQYGDTSTRPSSRLDTFQSLLKDRLQQSANSTNSLISIYNTRRANAANAANVPTIRTPTTGQKFNSSNTVAKGSKSTTSAVRNSVGGSLYSKGMWGGYSNGNIPASAMRRSSGALLRGDASQAFDQMNTAYRSQFGRDISVTDSYRNYAQQVSLKRTKGKLAATPGRSNHGKGLALDLGGGINSNGTAQHRWVEANASRYGFNKPMSYEPWHWEFIK